MEIDEIECNLDDDIDDEHYTTNSKSNHHTYHSNNRKEETKNTLKSGSFHLNNAALLLHNPRNYSTFQPSSNKGKEKMNQSMMPSFIN